MISRLTTLTHPMTTHVVSLATVKRALKVEYPDDDDVLQDMIAEASSAVEEELGYPLGRGVYREHVPGAGRQRLLLSYVPLVAIAQVLYKGSTVTASTYHVEHPPLAGMLWRDAGWDWTGRTTRVLGEVPVGFEETPDYQVDYTAGWLLETDNVVQQTTISASSTDNSYNDSAAGFPLLVAGDRIRVVGFTAVANNGTKTVVSRTASKIVVSETLVTEVAGRKVSIVVKTVPGAVERAGIDIVRALYLQRQWDMTGPRVIQTEGGTAVLNAPRGGIPDSARNFLLPFCKVDVL